MKKLFKICATACAVVTATASLAALTACSDGEKDDKKPSGKTHDPITLQVAGKDTFEAHNFVDGKCTMCDETTIFTQDPISGKDVITKACDQQGKVEKITYQSNAYGEEPVEKTAYVYLPYGYDAENTSVKYDVLYMLHGKGLNEGYWFAQGSYSPTDGIYTSGFGTQNVLDNLMKEGKAKKTICVSPTYYKVSDGTEVTGDFTKELTEELMPYVAANYNTYAAGTNAEQLKANRDHQGYVGLSLGSMYSYSVVWSNCLEYFSYIGSFSGGTNEAGWNKIIEEKNSTYKNCDINYWYCGLGAVETDKNYPGLPLESYLAIKAGVNLQSGSDIKAGDNCEFVKCNKAGHNYQAWITALYNCMQVFFRK